jgi:hypothetical protein
MFNRIEGNWGSSQLLDVRGQAFVVGDIVARAFTSGMACNLEVVEITEIKNGKLYLNGSKSPIQCPGRLLIVSSMFTGAAPPTILHVQAPRDEDKDDTAIDDMLKQI